MKKIFTLMYCLMAVVLVSNAQEHETLKETDTKEVYCMVVGEGRLFSDKCTITIDFGQKTSFWASSAQMKIVDENGKAVKFNSIIDACNYVADLGWKFVDAYAMIDGKQGNCYHYIFKKVVKKGEHADFNVKGNKQSKTFDDNDGVY